MAKPMNEGSIIMNIDYHKFPFRNVLAFIQHYDAKKYWRRREYVVREGGIKLLKLFCLLYVKRCDAYNKASLGTDWNRGAVFETVPKLPHGLNGIIISPDAHIGKNCTIFHQVTIGNDYSKLENAPVIGDHVSIFPGAKIVGKVHVGNNCKIGANAVVVKDVPENSLVLVGEQRILSQRE